MTVAAYWEARYRAGKRWSGPGSRGEAAARKAAFVNGLVATHRVRRVIDWGCGDGVVARLIRSRRYIGLDVSETALALCRQRVQAPRRHWLHYDGFTAPAMPYGDLALSLDVIFHLTDDALYRRHLDLVFASAPLVCVHSSNRDEAGQPHVRHRRFTDDVPAGWDVWSRPAEGEPIGFWVFTKGAQ